MSEPKTSMIRMMPLGPRLGWMVAAVLCFLIECMDVVGLLVKPDDAGMLMGLAGEPGVQAHVTRLLDAAQSSYWLMRANTLLLGAIGGLAAARFASGISRSLSELRAAAQRVAAGDLDTPVKVVGAFEVGLLARSIDRMRLSLREGLRIARENASLKEDLLLSEAAGALLAPKDGTSEALRGFHAIAGQRVGFWCHSQGQAGRRVVVLGYVEGSGPAAVISLAALAGAVRDELLHVKDVDPRGLARRAHQLCSGLTPLPVGVSVLSLELEKGQGHWVSAGAGSPHFMFHRESMVEPAEQGLRSGRLTFDGRLAISMGPEGHDAGQVLTSALERAIAGSGEEMASILGREEMPATLVMMRPANDLSVQAA